MAEVDKKEMETSEAVGKAADSETKGSGKKSDAPKKKKKSGFGEKVKKFWRDYKSEFKKIVWPTRKQTVRSTAVVLTVCLRVGSCHRPVGSRVLHGPQRIGNHFLSVTGKDFGIR